MPDSSRRWRRPVFRPEDWLPRALVAVGIGATVAQNVAAGSRGGAGGALLGVLPPAGLLLSLETLIWLVRRLAERRGGWVWCVAAGVPLAGLAGITGVISYLHSLTVARWTAVPGEVGMSLTEHLVPLVADLMIATGSVALVALARSRARRPAARPEPERKPDSRPAAPAASTAAVRKPGRKKGSGRAAAQVEERLAGLSPARVEELAALGRIQMAAELGVSDWSVRAWMAKRKASLAAAGSSANGNGHGPEVA